MCQFERCLSPHSTYGVPLWGALQGIQWGRSELLLTASGQPVPGRPHSDACNTMHAGCRAEQGCQRWCWGSMPHRQSSTAAAATGCLLDPPRPAFQ